MAAANMTEKEEKRAVLLHIVGKHVSFERYVFRHAGQAPSGSISNQVTLLR